MSGKKQNLSSFSSLEPILQVWGWILLAWSLYRYFLHLPEWIDEFVAKPLVFVLPVLWYVRNVERATFDTLGITAKNLFTNLYVGMGFGFVFALEGLLANAVKYGKVNILPIAAVGENGLIGLLILSVATSIAEELLSRGFLFTRILARTKSVSVAALLSTVLFVCLHVPILVTALHLQGVTLVLFFVTTFVLGLANALLFYNTGSLVAPILVHVFWNMTVALYL